MLFISPGRRAEATTRVGLRAAATAALLLGACASADRVSAPAPAARADLGAAALPPVRISEFHYDNAGTDANEAIEVSFPVGTDLTGYRVVRFNGNTASAAVAYTSPGVAAGSSETLSALTPTACGNGTRATVVVRYAVDGLQNGERDGFALVNGSTVVELLSYEGTFTVSSSASVAAGQTSVDVGVAESNSTPAGSSLARTSANTWSAAAPNTFGACNDGDDGGPPPAVGPLDRLTVTPENASLAAGASTTFNAVAEDAEGDDIADGVITWTDNGSPNVTVTPTSDGRSATVRGDAAGGPVAVVASLTQGGVTRADTAFVTVTAPGRTSRVAFSGFNAAPLPPGFEDQIFARAFSGPSNADSLPDVTFTWRALTPALGTIDANGVVRGVGDGRAQFEARSSDGFLDTAFVTVRTPADPTSAVYADHLEFGTPADASPGDDYLVRYPEFAASYNAARGQPNWIAYNLEATHRGPAERCDCFSPDTTLPSAFRRVSTQDYTGSGYSRGHMVMSEDRTTGPNPPETSVDNARTFLFTNIVPQTAANNAGPWLDLETYLGGLAVGGTREVYIYAGGAQFQGTLKNEGHVAIPSRTWKVAVVLERDRGRGDVRTASSVVEVIAVDMPNLAADTAGLRGRGWREFRVSVDSVERLTGYDFLAALPDTLEAQLEAAAPATRAVGIDVTPDRVSLASTPAVTVVLYSGAAFDATAAAAPADLRLVVDGGASAAPITRGGAVNTSTRDVDGDGRPDRVISFSTSALRTAGLRAGSVLTLVPAGTTPAFRGSDATPPVVAP